MSKNPFREAVLEKKEFTYTLELVPGQDRQVVEDAQARAER